MYIVTLLFFFSLAFFRLAFTRTLDLEPQCVGALVGLAILELNNQQVSILSYMLRLLGYTHFFKQSKNLRIQNLRV